MSSTVVVIARSQISTMRFSMSSGSKPVYVQITLTTGILMAGKMSTGIVKIEPMPSMAIRTAMTTKVRGRGKARRTSHIMGESTPRYVYGKLRDIFTVLMSEYQIWRNTPVLHNLSETLHPRQRRILG